MVMTKSRPNADAREGDLGGGERAKKETRTEPEMTILQTTLRSSATTPPLNSTAPLLKGTKIRVAPSTMRVSRTATASLLPKRRIASDPRISSSPRTPWTRKDSSSSS
jgi:hypothetical protein